MMKDEIDKINKEIEKLQKSKDDIFISYIDSISKTLREWREILSEEDFNKYMIHYWVTHISYVEGTSYWDIVTDEGCQKHYSDFYNKKINSNKKLLLAQGEKFFKIHKSIYCPSSARSTTEETNIEMSGKYLYYEFHMSHLNGYNSIVSDGHQEFRINTKNGKIDGYSSNIKDNNHFGCLDKIKMLKTISL